jgi:hypothetical protein
MIEELENLRRDLKRRYGSSWRILEGSEKMLIVNKIASIFNKYWRGNIKPRLSGKPWRSAFELLQDAAGDEGRKECRLVHQWVAGQLSTESFAESFASVILSYLGSQARERKTTLRAGTPSNIDKNFAFL